MPRNVLLACLIALLFTGCDEECEVDADCDDGVECNGFTGVCRSGLCTLAPEPACCERDADCNDGRFCNGEETCDDGQCVADEAPCRATQSCLETVDQCVTDCGRNMDADGDGEPSVACGGVDCDDADGQRGPGRAEICDNDDLDEDCNATTFGERDADDDGYIDVRCRNLDGDEIISGGTDCDDTNPGAHPGLHEACNSVDDDCDGAIDEGVLVGMWLDDDGDGYGTGESELLCAGLFGYASRGGDCDDARSQLHPGAFRCVTEGESFEIQFCDDDGAWGAVDECPGGGLCVPQPDASGVCLPGTEATQCADGEDNDGDDRVDFPSDAQCSSPLDNSESPRACGDGADNDDDLASDYPSDPGCTSLEDGSETDPMTPPACSNGEDDDEDGTIDFLDGTGDPGCVSAADGSERELLGPRCDNGLDDDGDDLIDFPAEAAACGVAGPNGDDEESVCMNGLDDDGDGAADFGADIGCESTTDTSERDTTPNALQCDDGMDNEGDGAADYPGDTGCTSAQDGKED